MKKIFIVSLLWLISTSIAKSQYTKSMYVENFPQLILGNTHAAQDLYCCSTSSKFFIINTYFLKSPPLGGIFESKPVRWGFRPRNTISNSKILNQYSQNIFSPDFKENAKFFLIPRNYIRNI